MRGPSHLVLPNNPRHLLLDMASRKKGEQFRRRRGNLSKRPNELVFFCNADAVIVIRRKGRYFAYQNRAEYTPQLDDLVKLLWLFRVGRRNDRM